MKCQYCNGTGEHVNDANRMTTCEFCGGTGICELGSPCPHQEPQTNEEYIRTCSTEELAILLYKIGFYSNITDDVMNTALMENIPTEEAFELWLKEKHE